MIFQVFQTLAESGREGIDGLFVYVANVVPIFIPMVLFAFFLIICLGTYFVQRRQGTRADFPASFAVAGYVTFVVSIIMSLVEDLINIETVIIVGIIMVIGTLWVFISSRQKGF